MYTMFLFYTECRHHIYQVHIIIYLDKHQTSCYRAKVHCYLKYELVYFTAFPLRVGTVREISKMYESLLTELANINKGIGVSFLAIFNEEKHVL